MKYLKYFEKQRDNSTDAKIGDLVWVEKFTNDPCELLEINNTKDLPDTLYMYYYKVKNIYTNDVWSFVPIVKKLTNDEIIEVKAKKYNV
jgi:hypothetical protein